jgi:hypothetical protein
LEYRRLERDPRADRTPPPVASRALAILHASIYDAVNGIVRSHEPYFAKGVALFWAEGPGTVTAPGHWNVIAQDVAAARRNSLQQNVRLFALLNVAMADAAICAWDAKDYYNFWRPVTAIREGEADGNPATAPDSDWISFITTPPFPDYISGTVHSAAQRPPSCRSSMEPQELHSPPDRMPCPVSFGNSEAFWTRYVRLRQPFVRWNSLQVGERRWLESRLEYRRVDVQAHHAAEVRALSSVWTRSRYASARIAI